MELLGACVPESRTKYLVGSSRLNCPKCSRLSGLLGSAFFSTHLITGIWKGSGKGIFKLCYLSLGAQGDTLFSVWVTYIYCVCILQLHVINWCTSQLWPILVVERIEMVVIKSLPAKRVNCAGGFGV